MIVVVVVLNLVIAYVVDRFEEQSKLNNLLELLLAVADVEDGGKKTTTLTDLKGAFESQAAAREPAGRLASGDVAQVLEKVNMSSVQRLQFSGYEIERVETRVREMDANHPETAGVEWAEFRELVLEALQAQYQSEQETLARTNRTL